MDTRTTALHTALDTAASDLYRVMAGLANGSTDAGAQLGTIEGIGASLQRALADYRQPAGQASASAPAPAQPARLG